MSQELTRKEMQEAVGGEITWLTVLCVVGGATAIFKILFSGRGSINIGPFKATWGN